MYCRGLECDSECYTFVTVTLLINSRFTPSVIVFQNTARIMNWINFSAHFLSSHILIDVARKKFLLWANLGVLRMDGVGLPDFQSRNTGDFCTRFRVPNGHEHCSCCCSCCTSRGYCCYQIFLSLRLCRFSTDRNQNFLHILMKICCIKLL